MAYISLPSDNIIVICTRILQSISKERLERDDLKISKQMLKKRLKWNLTEYYFTREQAIDYLNTYSDMWRSGFAPWHSEFAERDRLKVKAILVAAQNSRKIYLNETDAELLFGQYK